MVKASRRKSSTSVGPNNTKKNSSNLDTSPRPEPKIIQRRNSSFASTSSPWFRRNSFLSASMVQNEEISIYESSSLSSSFYSNSSPINKFPNYNIISLKESQGFIFNQDLFATPYQQLRSLATERRNSSLSGNPLNSLRSRRRNSVKCERRRHTSYHPTRPFLNQEHKSNNDDAIDDEEDEEMHDATEELLPIPNSQLIDEVIEDEEGDVSSHEETNVDFNDDEDEEIEEFDDEEDDAEEYHDMTGYGGDLGNRRYNVQVTEIIIDDKDLDIFPT